MRISSCPAVSEVLKLLDAGVSKEVVATYVETTPVTSPPSAADIIALKEAGAEDAIANALLRRGAEAREQAAKRRAAALSSALAARDAHRSGLDPESYDYFWYHYLYPRTLASAYQTLGGYPGIYYGYYPSGPVGPYLRYRP